MTRSVFTLYLLPEYALWNNPLILLSPQVDDSAGLGKKLLTPQQKNLLSLRKCY